MKDFLFPLLKNSESGVDDQGHRLRSGSLVTNLPGAASSMNTKNGRVQEKSVLVHWYLFSFFSELTMN